MTSRPITERQTRTEGSRRSVRREVRRRGFLPSFGDIILPIVGLGAMILLFLAGRQFFISGLQPSPGIASTRAYVDSPVLIAERERKEKEEEEKERQERQNLSSGDVTKPGEPEKITEDTVYAVAASESKSETEPAVAVPQQPATTAKTQVNKPSPAKKMAAAIAVVPANKQWRVQIGAYGTKQGAQDNANKLTKAGYKTTVYSNPASKYYKVWVQAGPTKQAAEIVAEALKKLGYKGSYVVPPPAK